MKQGWVTSWSCVLLLGSATAVAAPAREADNLPVPPVPASVVGPRIALPVVPSFTLPRAEGGIHDVRELRVRGRRLLGAQLAVKGYITWIYDCVVALTKPGIPKMDTQLLIDDNPQLCERPKFYLAASPRAAPEAALWVVDVPRAANKREQIALSAAQLGMRPPVPRIAVGDLVAVTGTFTLQSPHGEQSSEGLLVYKHLTHVAPGAPRIATPPPDPSEVAATVEPVVDRTPPSREVVPMRARNESIEDYEGCNRALDEQQLDAAIVACRRAVDWWSGNHLAWYALGNARAGRTDWRGARDAYDRAVALRPDAAMYQLYDGIAWYEVAVRQAAADEAHRRDHAPDAVNVALRAIARDTTVGGGAWKPYRVAAALATADVETPAAFERARQALSRAAHLAPQLWLASYYLGSVERAQDHAKPAAEAFASAIQAAPSQADPYIALIKLYRTWDLHDQSLAVARQASNHVTSGPRASLWFELGMTYEVTRHDDEALAAFTRAIAAGGTVQARFQRGQIYARLGDFVRARADLVAVLAGEDPSLGFVKQIAHTLLGAVERGQRADRVYLRLPMHYEGQ
ncbi:MAG: tetratricopeptide repeat protein [Kofleriaceae bacterium]